MIKYLFYSILVIGFPIILKKIFPSNNENAIAFTLAVFSIIIVWLLFGIYIFFIKKNKVPHFVFLLIAVVLVLITYNLYPWYKNYTGYEIVKDCLSTKRNAKNINLEWQYSLSQNIENYPLIALSQKKFKKINPDKRYLVQCFYYNNRGIQEYVKKFIIYFREGVPYSTSATLNFAKKMQNEYLLIHNVDDSSKVFITTKNGKFDLDSLGFKSYIESSENIEIYSKEFGKYIYEIKRQNELNVFNVSEVYWIYKLI